MELSEYIETLRGEVASITRVAGEDVARAGQMIAEALDSSIRLTLLDVLSGAAAEITSRLDNTAIELRPSEPTGHVKLGQLLANRGRFDEARQHFRQALGVAPNNQDARRSLSILDQMSHAIRNDSRLAAPCACQNENRPFDSFYSFQLFGIKKFREIH